MTYALLKLVPEFQVDRRAVTTMEYAILAGVIATVILAGFELFGTGLSTAFASMAALMPPTS